MCHYTHLTPFEREKILFFRADGKSITEIAHLLNRSKSTISRELRRNAAPPDRPMPYVFCQADFPIFVVGIPHRHRGEIPTFSGPCQEAGSTTASCRMRACSIR